ncbi:uncharacterized protein LOC125198388 isoform X3 [Salvia hispanica]|uniref:uncharacterized protein LOC125198388 isoform X3 n=1 Tax=Salvia hispanica TaxID=49212 RepID=UPI002009B6AD|nr:uncharacterized protein LOC125198388 isoform X3 [Salvia hispanica]
MLWFGDSLSKVMPWIKEHILEFWMVILISGTSSGFRLIGDKSGGDQVTKKRTRGGLVFSTLSVQFSTRNRKETEFGRPVISVFYCICKYH